MAIGFWPTESVTALANDTFLRQPLPLAHTKLVSHPEFVTTSQLVAQLFVPHAKPDAQLFATAPQAPMLQSMSVSIVPEHVEAPQLLVGYAHSIADPPLHEPAHRVPLPAQEGCELCGAPEATIVHVPSAPATSGMSHAWHCPAHEPSQQTPSTQ